MSSDDEDDLCRFGTPLDPIEEDEVPSTKKITLADQIAVDSNGKRRFHGAFTGGFSAGFWNTVGSRDGWTPSEFKSSRGEKASHRVQRPSDFMDEEDVGEFGIAPQRIQTTEDFAPSEDRQKNKRKLQSDPLQGPIPGAPVLELVLESCRDKAAVRLLKRMDKKYAATISEKSKKSTVIEVEDEPMQPTESTDATKSTETIEEAESDVQTEEVAGEKVYKCDMGPIQRLSRSGSIDSDASSSDEELVFDEDEFDSMFDNLKTNRFGLKYVGLDKGTFFTTVGAEAPIIQNNFNILPTFTMVDQNKKKVTIRGQAFGVGAFEEDDDDIYGRDDMSKYDFRLDTQAEKSSKKSIKNVERGFISGFSEAIKTVARITTKNVFKVKLPFGYEPRNWQKRKSRFGPEVVASTSASSVKGPADKVIGRHDLTPDQRGQILGDKKTDSISDIDAKLKAAGLKTMNFTVGGIENKPDDQPEVVTDGMSSKIDETLAKFRNKSFVVPESIPQIFDRFTASNDTKPLSELDSTEVNKAKEAPAAPEAPKEVQKVVRTKSTWIPCQLLCYKMNMEASVGSKPEKGNTFSLFECIANTESARRNRLEFTGVRHEESDQAEIKRLEEKFQEKSHRSLQEKLMPPTSARKMEEMFVPKVPPAMEQNTVDMSDSIERSESKSESIKRSKPKTELEKKIIDAQDEHPSKKKDIFKAIFDSDSESEESEDDGKTGDVSKSSSIAADLMASLSKPSTSSTAIYSQLPDEAFRPKSAKEINILRNTSPPRGIFTGLIKKPAPTTEQLNTSESGSSDKKSSTTVDEDDTAPDTYGPSLPPVRKMSSLNGNPDKSAAPPANATSSVAAISLGKNSDYKVIYEEKWIEKSDEKEKKSKKEKKHKKDRDKHKSKKQKKEKHKKKKR